MTGDFPATHVADDQRVYSWIDHGYPLAMTNIAVERSTMFHGRSTIAKAIFNSYVKLPAGKWMIPEWIMMDHNGLMD